MILKVIYQGFKSFADRIEVDFSKGFTSVIGPNGCGKSNIIDGIRWVLGEQSAKSLRGGKMEDIIFHGTEKRKQGNQAEVTIILDNSNRIFKAVDTDQVSVTRRTFRKGGSEYLINGEMSRLKDVQTLFLDSGIGSRSYSLIGQEQAKKILSTKIDERRAIFEEAAGIVKFKQEKEQTQKTLAEVENNLTRMDDILHELNKQLEPLGREAKKAQKHNEISTQLKTLEIQYLLNQFDVLKVDIEQLHGIIEEQTAEVNKYQTNLTEGETILDTIKQKYQEDNEDVFSSQNVLGTKKEEMDKIESDIALLIERTANSESKILDFASQLNEIESKHSLSMEEFNRKQERLNVVNSDLEIKKKEFDELNEKINSVENDKLDVVSSYEHYRNKSVELYNSITQKQYERTQLKEKEQEAKDKIHFIQTSLSEIEQEYSDAKKVYQELKHTYDELNSKKTNLTTEVEEKTQFLSQSNNEYETLSSSLKQLQKRQFELKSKIDSVESFMENNDGFFDGVKVILTEKKKGTFPNVLGAVAELIKVDKTYEIAIDTLLQSTMQSIVTTDDATAKACIQFLNKGKLGRATFLPINLAQSSTFSKDELNTITSYQGIRPAIEAISFNNDVAPVIQSRLGRSLIADNLDVALEFIKKSKIKTRVSTVDGEIVQAGAITGGASNRKKTNFFTKKRELEEYKTELTNVESSLEENQAKTTSLEEQLLSAKQIINQITEELVSVNNELTEQYTSLKDAENTYERINEKNEDLLTEQKELKISSEEYSQKVMNLKFDIEKLETEQDETNQKLENLHSEKETQDGSLSSMLKEASDTQTLLVRLEEEFKQLSAYMDTFGANASEIQNKINALQEREQEEKTAIENNQQEIKTLQTSLATLNDEYESVKTNLSERRGQTQSAVDEINRLEKEMKELRTTKEVKEQELNKSNIEYSKLETAFANINQRLLDDYEITEETVNDFERQEIDMKNSKKEVDKLRKSLSSLGNVNHNAIEQYEEISARYESENKQSIDSKKAKEDLLLLIKSIEEEMTVRFVETFEEISKHFEQTFVHLFEGGSGKLKLMDKNNPLTSEIDIITQPPGKASGKSISLLSGGEQSLAAVALIFAIILAKPSPFVILDEVDAPLDDSNVSRYAKFVKKLSRDNQFIVITHRKGTKMESDFMYGVTHEELGVSVVTALKLDFSEKTG